MLPRDTRGVLADRYALDDVIGRGGMADVYLATDQVLERDVAVKVLRTHAVTDRDRGRFRDEAKLLAALDHPGLVTVLDAGLSEEDVPYLVMEYVDGTSLATLCQNGPVPAHRIAPIGVDLASVLTYVHGREIVHRDIKPSNILVGRDGVVRLADFGIARMMGETSGHTASGTTIGTAAYIAPEQVRGDRVTPAGDIYSLGLVLLEALTGRRAYTGAPVEAALARLHAAPLIPTSLPTGWPALLSRMTDMDPARRPDAVEVVRAMRALDGPETSSHHGRRTGDVVSSPVDEPAAPRRAVRRGARGAGVASLGAAVTVTFGVVGLSLAASAPGGSDRTQVVGPHR
jgi:serine/threonine protein kinase